MGAYLVLVIVVLGGLAGLITYLLMNRHYKKLTPESLAAKVIQDTGERDKLAQYAVGNNSADTFHCCLVR